MDNLPLISVIIPVYNAEKYIERCINSIVKQSYVNWELIIVDDGSIDDSFNIASYLAESDVRIQVMHTENYGVCSARNLGIEVAKGEYITFLDSDDELESWTLDRLYSMCIENNSDIAIGQCKRIKDSGEIIESQYPKEFELWKNQEAIRHSLEDHPATYSVWGKLYKRKIIGDTKFDIGHKVHEDSFFLFELLIKNPTVVVKNEYIYRYHITSNSASRAIFSDKFLDILYFVNRKKIIIEGGHPELGVYIPNLIIKANMALLKNLCKTTDSRYAKVEKRCLREVLYHKKQFKPATKEDEKWFWIISHHLYRPYKLIRLLIRR